MNLKLIKTYLAFNDKHSYETYLLKAYKHIIQNEISLPLFTSSTLNKYEYQGNQEPYLYHRKLYDLLYKQNGQEKHEIYLIIMRVIILKQLILLKLKFCNVDENELVKLFNDYLILVSNFSLKFSKRNDDFLNCLVDEYKSHVFYSIGLFLFKSQQYADTVTNQLFQNQVDSEDLDMDNEQLNVLMENNYILATVCLLKSLNTSKPNKPLYSNMTSRIDNQTQIDNLIVKCHQRDSAWRYSIISSWLKHKLRSCKNKVIFFKKLVVLSKA